MADMLDIVLDLSYKGSFVIIAVIILRFAFKRLPKVYSYALWSVAAFRLICPVSFSSVISVFNIIPQKIYDYPAKTALKTAGKAAGEAVFTNGVVMGNAAEVSVPYVSGFSVSDLIPYIYMLVAAAFIAHGIFSYVKMKRRVRFAVLFRENIYRCSDICSPFVLGIFRPKIYIPFRLRADEEEYIVCHEKYHIKRKDNIIKIFAYIILSVHWFNPLVWAAYCLFERDMEMSCDEKVVSVLGNGIKSDYSMSLLAFALNRRFKAPVPLSFGESCTKSRVKNILGFKKPKAVIAVIALAVLIAAAAVLAADPFSGGILKYSPNYLQSHGSEGLYEYKATDKMDSYIIYGEIYDRGALKERTVLSYGDLNIKKGSFSVWFKDADLDNGDLVLSAGFNGDGLDTVMSMPQKQYNGFAMSFAGDDKKRIKVIETSDIALMAVNFSEAGTDIKPLKCESLTGEYGYLLAQNGTVAVVRAAFSGDSPKNLKACIEGGRLAQTLFEHKNPYIGDHVSDGRILGDLGIGYDLGSYTVELQTGAEPYSLKVVFDSFVKEEDRPYFDSRILYYSRPILALIENAGSVEWEYKYHNGERYVTHVRTYSVDEAREELGRDIKEFGESPEKIAELLDMETMSESAESAGQYKAGS